MRNYEITLILSSVKQEEELNDIFQKFIAFIQEQGGILEKQQIIGKRHLGSPIQKKEEGILATVSFSISQEKLPEIEKALKETTDVLRYLISHKKPIRLAKQRPKKERVFTTAPRETTAEKIELKNIDEKLEEIFKEQ